MNTTAENRRASRRHDEQRKKAKCRRIVKEVWFDSKELADNLKFIGRMAHTPHPCSALCCGNPRRHCKGKEVKTIQERKAEDVA